MSEQDSQHESSTEDVTDSDDPARELMNAPPLKRGEEWSTTR